MSNISSYQKNQLPAFFVISFAITWLLQLPRLLSDNDIVELPGFLIGLNAAALIGPFIAAFWLTYRVAGREGMKTLWKRGWNFEFEKKWLVVIFLIPIVINALTILILPFFGGNISWDQAPLPLQLAPLIFVLIFLTQALPEEYGWRGFALDRLQGKWNALTASLVLGFFWGLWHLPLHFMTGTTQAIIPVWEFILKQMVGAIFYTWIYNNTNRNVFLAILTHAVWNVFGGLIPYWITSEGRWVNFGIEVLLAAVVVVVYGARTLTRKEKSSHTSSYLTL